MNIETIMTYVTAFLGSSVGATLIGVIAKAIVNKVAEVKLAKSAKLSENDKAEIASIVAEKVTNEFAGGVKIDAEALMNKYTSDRIEKLERSQNELIDAISQTKKYAKVTMSAVGDFKTISMQSKGEIASLLKDEEVVVEKVQEVTQPIVEKVTEAKKTLKY